MSCAAIRRLAIGWTLGLVLTVVPLLLTVPSVRAGSAFGEPADQLFKNGLEALADKQPDEARQFFERILKVYPRTRASAAAERELLHLNGVGRDSSVDTFAGEDETPDNATPPQTGIANQQAKLLRRGFVTEVGDRVFFAENSATVGGRARAVIEAEARWLKARPDVRIKIIGRADDGGSAEDGRLLSTKRAEAVRDKLVESGLPAERLVIEARGNQDPVATCNSALCQAQNRNVETLIAPSGEDFAEGGGYQATRGRKDAAVSDPAGGRALAR